MAFNRSTFYAHLTSGTDGAPYLPGNGVGSVLARVTAAKNITAQTTNPLIITLSDVTSLVVGQLVISTDGFWGTIAEINPSGFAANSIRVHGWRWHRLSGDKQRPATGSSNLNIFPAGSILAGMTSSARIERLIITKSITGASANYILDHRLATATPVLPYTSVVGQVFEVECEMDVTSPFFLQVGTLANCNITAVFSMN